MLFRMRNGHRSVVRLGWTECFLSLRLAGALLMTFFLKFYVNGTLVVVPVCFHNCHATLTISEDTYTYREISSVIARKICCTANPTLYVCLRRLFIRQREGIQVPMRPFSSVHKEREFKCADGSRHWVLPVM